MGEQRCDGCEFWWQRGHNLPPSSRHHEDGAAHTRPVRMCRRFPAYVWRSATEWCGEYQEAGRAALAPPSTEGVT